MYTSKILLPLSAINFLVRQVILTVAVTSFFVICTNALAQTHTSNFGPSQSFVNGNSGTRPSVSFTLSVPTTTASNGTLSITVAGDLDFAGGGGFFDERLRVLVDGVLVRDANQSQCGADTNTIVIPQATLASIISDGQVIVTFEGGLETNNFCTPVGPFTASNFSLAALGSLSFTTGGTPALSVTGASNHTGSGPQGGAFTGSPGSYTVQNSGSGTLNWTVSGPSWLNFSATSGSLGAGLSTTVNVTFNASANSLPAGTQTGTITFGGDGGTATRNATLTVNDITPPTWSGTPANITVYTPPNSATAVATWTPPSASDNVGVTSTGSNLAPGASFPVGTTIVTYTASDAASNVGLTSFTVTVIDNVAPVITGTPGNITVDATGPSGAVVTYLSPTANDNVNGPVVVNSTNPSGSTFPVGTTTVTFSATDGALNTSTTTFQVTVTDTTAPSITGVPANVVLEATSPAGAVLTYTMPTATDIVDGARPVSASHPSGSTFPFTAPGPTVTTVTFSASDLATPNNTAGASFTVTVQDTTDPVLSGVSGNITVEATSPSGAVVTYPAAGASDIADAAPTIAYSHPSGSTFPIGTTIVTVTATDASNNVSSAQFTVTVNDTTGPTIGAVSNITVTAPDLTGATVTFSLPSATDAGDPAPTVAASPASGSFFPIGVTTVTVTATDAFANASTTSFTVTVLMPANMAVTPNTAFASSGPQGQQGAPFSPSSQNYTVTNNGQVPMNYTVTGAPAWVTLTNGSGTIPAGGNATVTVALNAAADALGVAVHSATLNFNNTTSGIGNTTRGVSLTVVAPAALSVSPAGGLVASGPQGQQGGAFSPSSQAFTLSNSGALPLAYAVTGAPAWITLTNASGTIPAGGSVTVTAALNAAANALPVAVHIGTLTFTNQTNGIGDTTRPVSIDVRTPAQIAMTPPEGLTASGFQGGPFSPASKVYTLNNPGAYPVNYTAAANQSWLTVAPASGTIPAGGSTTVTLSVNASANALPSATHNGTLTVTNTTNGLGTATRSAGLTVIPNGQVIVRVATVEGDGTFNFSSPTPSLNLSVATTGGAGQSAAITLNPGAYSITAALPDGFGLTGVSCNDSNSTGNVAAKSASISLASAEVVTCTFTAANSRKKTVEVIQQFMSLRNDMLLTNGPDQSRWIERLMQGGGDGEGASFQDGRRGQGLLGANGEQPITASRAISAKTQEVLDKSLLTMGLHTARDMDETGFYPEDDGIRRLSGGGESKNFSFAASLASLRQWSAGRGDVANAGDPGAQAGGRKQGRLDVWIEGHYAQFGDDRAATDSDGHFGVLYVGADYIVRPWLLVGLLAQADEMKQSSVTDSFSIEGTGWMAGPYMTMRLNERLFLQARAAFGSSENEVSPFLTYTDSFDSQRWLVSSTLTGAFEKNRWMIRPSASLAYIEDKSDAYVDGLGVPIPSVRTSLGQFRAEPEVSYVYKLAGGTILEPKVGAAVIWNFDSSNRVANFGGTLAGPQEARGKVSGGMAARFVGGTIVDLEASYDGLGSDDFHAAAGQVTLRVPLN